MNDNETALILDKLIDHERRLSRQLKQDREHATIAREAAGRIMARTEAAEDEADDRYQRSLSYLKSLTHTRLHLSLIDYTLEDLEK